MRWRVGILGSALLLSGGFVEAQCDAPPSPGGIVIPFGSRNGARGGSPIPAATPRHRKSPVRTSLRDRPPPYPIWQQWWDRNRALLLRGPATPRTQTRSKVRMPATPAADGPEILALRKAALGDPDLDVRIAARWALGVVGDASDARECLQVFANPRAPERSLRCAALAAALLEPKGDVHRALQSTLAKRLDRGVRDGHTRRAFIVALGLLARRDPLMGSVLQREDGSWRGLSFEDQAAWLAAYGVSRSPLLHAELLKLAGDTSPLSAEGRTEAVRQLGWCTGDSALALCVKILDDDAAPLELRQAAVFVIGRRVHDKTPPPRRLECQSRLLHLLRNEKDPLLRGYAALVLGQVADRTGRDALAASLGRVEEKAVRPWIALALGLAARRAGGDELVSLRRTLNKAAVRARAAEIKVKNIAPHNGLATSRPSRPGYSVKGRFLALWDYASATTVGAGLARTSHVAGVAKERAASRQVADRGRRASLEVLAFLAPSAMTDRARQAPWRFDPEAGWSIEAFAFPELAVVVRSTLGGMRSTTRLAHRFLEWAASNGTEELVKALGSGRRSYMRAAAARALGLLGRDRTGDLPFELARALWASGPAHRLDPKPEDPRTHRPDAPDKHTPVLPPRRGT